MPSRPARGRRPRPGLPFRLPRVFLGWLLLGGPRRGYREAWAEDLVQAWPKDVGAPPRLLPGHDKRTSKCPCTLAQCQAFCLYTGPIQTLVKQLEVDNADPVQQRTTKEQRSYLEEKRMTYTYGAVCGDINYNPGQVSFYVFLAVFGFFFGWFLHMYVAYSVRKSLILYGWVEPDDYSEAGSSEYNIEDEMYRTRASKRMILTKRKVELKCMVREMFDRSVWIPRIRTQISQMELNMSKAGGGGGRGGGREDDFSGSEDFDDDDLGSLASSASTQPRGKRGKKGGGGRRRIEESSVSGGSDWM